MPTDSAATAPAAGRLAAMRFIMLAVLIDMMAIGLMIPVLPHLVGQFTSSHSDQAFWYGAVAFAFGVANFFGSPILGALSDRYGRRPVLLIGFCGLGFILGPALGAGLLAWVSDAPRGDVRLGLPLFGGGLLQLLAMGLAIWHFYYRRAALAATTPA